MPESNLRTRVRVLVRLLQLTLALMVATPALEARAATIGLEADESAVIAGDLIEVRIFGEDFLDGTEGGDFALRWSSNLSFVGLAIEDPPWDLSAYDEAGAGERFIEFVDVFSFVDTPGVGGARFEIATLMLLASASGLAEVALEVAQVGWGLAGLVVDDVVYGAPISISVSPIPEPGTTSLIGLGLVLLSARRERQFFRDRPGSSDANRR